MTEAFHVNLPISALVVAAGPTRRAAPHTKQLLPLHGTTVVRATVEAMCGADFAETIVVVGHERARIETALAGLRVRFVFAAAFASGMGHSLAAGVCATAPDARGFAVTPGDLPQLTPALVRSIAARFVEADGARHLVPTSGRERGHPVILGAWLRRALEDLRGDTGARGLLASPAEKVRCEFFDVGNDAILRDVDHA
jgi:molybdenum cofactor cytidylyltransferase